VLFNKHKELKDGKGIFNIGNTQTDLRVNEGYDKFVDLVHHLTISTLKQYVQKATLYIENYFIKLFHYITRRFFSFSNIITGQNIPKNRGSVSFFLKNIEEHKKSVSGR
jgi:hypothetical protein